MNQVNFPNAEHAQLAACEWIAKIDRGLSEEEENQLSLWLHQSSLHGEHLVKCASMWDLLDILSPISKLMPMETLQLLNHKPVRTDRSWFWYCAAAALIAAVGVYGFNQSSIGVVSSPIANNTASQTETVVANQGQRFKTAIGEMSTVKLVDGSEMQLNTDSEVWVRYGPSSRQIELLNGEVFFDVAKDDTKPFVVNVGDDQVVAVGTAFNIDARPGLDTEVLVAEGKVKVNVNVENQGRDATKLLLTPGQSVTIMDDAPQIKYEQDPETLLSWRDGVLIFQGESLAEAIAEIGRYTSMRFTITDSEIAKIPVGGFFKTGDTEQLLLVLRQNFGVQSTRIGDEILLHAL